MKPILIIALSLAVAIASCGEKKDSVGDKSDTTVEKGIYEGFRLLTQQERDKAQQMLEAALRARPDDPLVMNNLAVLLAHKRDFGRALELLAKARPLAAKVEVSDYMYFSVVISKPAPPAPLKSFLRAGASSDGLLPSVRGDFFFRDGDGIPREISWLNRNITDDAKMRELHLLQQYVVENIDSVQSARAGKQ